MIITIMIELKINFIRYTGTMPPIFETNPMRKSNPEFEFAVRGFLVDDTRCEFFVEMVKEFAANSLFQGLEIERRGLRKDELKVHVVDCIANVYHVTKRMVFRRPEIVSKKCVEKMIAGIHDLYWEFKNQTVEQLKHSIKRSDDFWDRLKVLEARSEHLFGPPEKERVNKT